MNEPAKDYNAIKELVESKENSIMNIKSIKNKDLEYKDMAFIPPQKKKKRKFSKMKYICYGQYYC